MLGGIGAQELILIFLVILLLFGARRIPEIASGLGKGLREFKKAMRDTQDEIEKAGDEKKEEDKKDTGESQEKKT
ncbi:MAG: twin-arginine translocase TatA/TatE family subunit [Candidatus Zixiibacteriota bacterium]